MINYLSKYDIKELNKTMILFLYRTGNCVLNCMNCINQLKDMKGDTKNIAQLMADVVSDNVKYDTIVLAGNEFLCEPLEDIGDDLLFLRKLTNKNIIIQTNGFFPTKMRQLLEHSLVDGFHTHIIMPWEFIDYEEEVWFVEQVAGKKLFAYEVANMKKGIDFTVRTDRGHSWLFTQKNPALTSEAYDFTKIWVAELNAEYDRHTPYFVF